jgi:uncharacterized membrane protein (UPF0127 family)
MRTHSLVVALVAALVGCKDKPADASADYSHVMAFDSTRVRLVAKRDTFNLRVELALTPTQKQMGLMERTSLAEGAGMLFVYDSTQAADAGFWMYRTRIPLDIAFLDSAGVIRSVRSMVPCTTEIAQGCKTYTPDVPYRHALEMSEGYFAKHGIGVGDSLLLRDLPESVHRPASSAGH